MSKTVLTVFGTRPEASKMAPVVLALRDAPGLRGICCVTAQHREMLDGVLSLFDIAPEYDLNIMKPGQSPTAVAARVLEGLEPVLAAAAPDMVLVHGDTTTAAAAALAAFYGGIPVGHVEAGLRTFDRKSPFPEEINRRVIAPLADLHFCPTEGNRRNLAREGITEGVFVTGNTAIDTVKRLARPDYPFETEELRRLTASGRRLVLITAHRRENYGAPLAQIFRAVARLSRDFPGVDFVYPVHLSPVVRQAASVLRDLPNVCLLDPLPLRENINLMARCALVLTDSGGLQEEAPALGVPVLVLRRETERPEAVEAGTVALAGVEEASVYSSAARLLSDEDARLAMARSVSPYGDGQAALRIVRAVARYLEAG